MADNPTNSASLVSSQVTPREPVPSAADRQLRSFLQEQISELKPPPGASIPRLLSPAPIGISAGSTYSSASSRRTSPVPPSNNLKPSHFDPDFPYDGIQPSTPKRRPGGISRGLSLQLSTGGSGEAAGSAIKVDARTPLTPKLDPAISYGSPASVLPRRSRGMDFSRAATHLHHSTIAEKPDPESSPIVGGRGISVPRRNVFESPMRGSGSVCGLDQNIMGSSLGSIVMDSGSDSSSDDDIAMRDEDEMLSTPQVGRMGMGGYTAANLNASPSGDAIRQFIAADGRNYRDRLRSSKNNPRKNSETKRNPSGWRYDWTANPVFNSPPVHRSIEGNESYFQKEISRRNIRSRRESLSLGTDELTIDDSTPGSDENQNPAEPFSTAGNTAEERKSVIRRAVTARRSQLIPKSKGFARIRAALLEENTPIDMENRREAEVIRQVKEREERKPDEAHISQPVTNASSPIMAPMTTVSTTDSPDDMSEINLESSGPIPSTRRSSSSFSIQASKHGAGTEFWNRFLDEDRLRTPPPPLFNSISSAASVFSEDANMGLDAPSASASTAAGPPLWPGNSNANETGQNSSGISNNDNSQGNQQTQHLQAGLPGKRRTSSPSRPRSSTPTTTTTVQTSFKALGKRRRDDELDSEFFKRRAVSPGLSSIAGSPILPPSPAQRDNTWWSRGNSGDSYGRKETPNGHVATDRLGSQSSEGGGGGRQNSGGRGVERRVGVQGMSEAGEGMMNMSID